MNFRSVSFLTVLVLLSAVAQTSFAKSITVSGVSEKSFEPTMVRLKAEIWSKAPSAKEAQKNVDLVMVDFKKAIDQFKISKEDVQTTDYNLTPDYQYDKAAGVSKVVGFNLVQIQAITLRNTAAVGQFLDVLVNSRKSSSYGVNINQLQWDSDKRSQIELLVLADAVKDTKKKADEIAKAAGVKIKNIENIVYSQRGYPSPEPRGFAMKGLMTADAASSSPELSGGEIRVRVEVQAEYELY